MTIQNISCLGPLVQSFFTQHLQQHKRVSPQTVASYRDTLKLLLQFVIFDDLSSCEFGPIQNPRIGS